jgi:methanogenic corrinoid protein MtbC1
MPREGTDARLSIGALASATGIPIETLRTWESRYGYPVPERKPSGHRVYPLSSVPRLKRIAQALANGHRAGQVVGATDSALAQLLEAVQRPATAGSVERGAPTTEALSLEELVRLIELFDADRLTRVLLGDWARLGPLRFLESRVAPLVRAVGDAWEAGRLQVRHEHFLSERVGDVLRSLRLPFEERATGPLVILGSLPGEEHGLGLQMAALTLAFAGCRLLFLGCQVPSAQMVALARDLGAAAVGISVSLASKGGSTPAQVQRLRRALPRRVALLIGGAGAPRATPGVTLLSDLRSLEVWAQAAAAGRPH